MDKKKLLILIILLVLLLIAVLVLTVFLNKKTNETPQAISVELDEKTSKKVKKAVDEALIETLSTMSEQRRVEYYATEFIKKLEARKTKSAYALLNSEFKTNYFKTEESFDKYIKNYFPKEVSVEYSNMERLGDLYVLDVEIKDILTSKNPNNFSFYIVIKENAYADYELSFSVDKPMKEKSERRRNRPIGTVLFGR